MKLNKKHLLLLSIMSAISGCANLTDNPYYRIWHDRAYAFNGSPTVMQQAAAESGVIPEAEPVTNGTIDTSVAQTIAYTDNASTNMQMENAYSVEGDPFRAYNRFGGENYNNYDNNQAPPMRDYSRMDNELR